MPEAGLRIPRRRRHAGCTGQCAKQSCRSSPPIGWPGLKCNKKSSKVPYATSGLATRELSWHKGWLQSWIKRTRPGLKTAFEGQMHKFAGGDAYQCSLPKAVQEGSVTL